MAPYKDKAKQNKQTLLINVVKQVEHEKFDMIRQKTYNNRFNQIKILFFENIIG